MREGIDALTMETCTQWPKKLCAARGGTCFCSNRIDQRLLNVLHVGPRNSLYKFESQLTDSAVMKFSYYNTWPLELGTCTTRVHESLRKLSDSKDCSDSVPVTLSVR